MPGLRLRQWTARDAVGRNDATAQRRRLQWKTNQPADISVHGTAAGHPGKHPAGS
jgi:hypothetical protein